MTPEPADGDAEAIAQADQEVDVGNTPYPPRQRSAQLDCAEIDHRLAFADLGQASGMAVTKRRGRCAGYPSENRCRDMASLLFGGGRDAGNRISRGVRNGDGVADRE